MRRGSLLAGPTLPRTRKLTALPSDRPNLKTSSIVLPPVTVMLDGLVRASEKEKRFQYDNYRTTGDFERDFTLLCSMIDMKMPLKKRVRLPSHHHNNNNNQQPEFPDMNHHQPKRAVSVFPTNQPHRDIDTEFEENSVILLPTTYLVAYNKYEYLKPRVEIETETDTTNHVIQSHVTQLYFKGSKLDTKMVNILFKTIPDLERLKVLHISHAGLDDDTMYWLGRCVALLPSLKTLCLDGNSHTKYQRFNVFLEDTNELKIHYLSLRHCNISDMGALQLSGALSENKHLIGLNLNFNRLGDRGTCHLAHALRTNRTLLSLNLSSNGIGDAGVQSLAETLSTFKFSHEEIIKRREMQSQELKKRKERPAIENLKVFREKTPKKKTGAKGREKKHRIERARTPDSHAVSPSSRNVSPVAAVVVEEKETPKHPLLETTVELNGELLVPGNRALINLNLSRNKVTPSGLQYLSAAVKCQTNAMLRSKRQPCALNGLLKLTLHKNSFPRDDPTYLSIVTSLLPREPFLDRAQNVEDEAH